MPTADCPEARLVLAVVLRAVHDVQAGGEGARDARRFIRSQRCQGWVRLCLDAIGRDDLDCAALVAHLREHLTRKNSMVK